MSNLREAAQDALAALNGVLDTYGEPLDKLSIAGGTFEALVCRDAITALRAALAQPEPAALEDIPACMFCGELIEPAATTVVEPVLFIHPSTLKWDKGHVGAWKPGYELPGYIPLYLAAPPRAALSDEQIRNLWFAAKPTEDGRSASWNFARAIEAAHGIGGPRNE